MKKQLIILLVCILLTGGLAAAYFISADLRKKEDARLAEEAQLKQSQNVSESIRLLSGDAESIKTILFDSDDFKMTIYPVKQWNEDYKTDETVWVIEGRENAVFDQWSISNIADASYNLNAAEKAMDNIDSPDQFGLTRPARTVTVTYTDDTTATLKIGKSTPDGEYYYCALSGDPALYLLSSYTAQSLMCTYDSFVSKAVITVNSSMITYADIKQKGQKEIELGYPGTEEQKLSDLQYYGTAALRMLKPFEGRQVYTENFSANVAEIFNMITFNKLVDIAPDDYSIYGLDEPEYEIVLSDAEYTSHIVFGSAVDDDYVYAKFGDSTPVFLADKYILEELMSVSMYSYIEKFVALIYVDKVDQLKIESPTESYTFDVMHTIIPAEKENEADDNILTPSINGTIIQEKAFQRFYQTVIGISSDSHVEGFVPSGKPEYTITYVLNSEPDTTVIKLYPYNNDFFISQVNDGPTEFVVNKQQVTMMMMYVKELLDGKLDD